MTQEKKLRKVLPLVALLGLTNTTLANECKSQISVETANSFITQTGMMSSDEVIIQPKLGIKCGNFKGYSTIIDRVNGQTDRYVIGGIGILPINSSNLTLRGGFDNLHISKKEKDIPRFRIGGTLKGEINLDFDYFKFLDRTEKSFLEWNINKKLKLDDNLDIYGKIGGTFNEGFTVDNRYYGEIGMNYNLNNSTSIFTIYQKQFEPIENEQIRFGIKYNL